MERLEVGGWGLEVSQNFDNFISHYVKYTLLLAK
jgi:hypothetical protein